jgi:tRNA G18 (ribose-2'-O)-methylase SpoU
MKRGYFGIGIENTKTKANIGTLWRSAFGLGAAFIFVIGNRYKKQASDTVKAMRHIPMYHYDTFEQFYENMPKDCQLIGVELHKRSRELSGYCHPERAIYLLGAEDNGLSDKAIVNCHSMVQFDSKQCLNVSVAGSIVMYDRNLKLKP